MILIWRQELEAHAV